MAQASRKRAELCSARAEQRDGMSYSLLALRACIRLRDTYGTLTRITNSVHGDIAVIMLMLREFPTGLQIR